jgi:hypothetical protein
VNFLPSTLEGWLVVIGTLIAWAVATQRVWRNLVDKVNGVGARVAVLEEKKAENATKIEHLENGHRIATSDRAHLHERMGRLEKENEGLTEQLTNLKIDVIGHINEVKSMIKEDGGVLRERVIRLEVLQEQRPRGETQ